MDDGREEELPATRPSPRRLRIDLAVGAVLLLGVLVALRLTGGHGKPAAAPSTSSAVPSPIGGYGTGAPDSGSGLLGGVSSSVTPSGQASGLPIRDSDDPAACPWPTGSNGEPGCTESHTVPAGAAAAVRAAFPSARVVFAETVRLAGGPIWFRQLNVYVGHDQLLVRVETPPPAGLPVAGSGEQGGTASVSGSLRQYHVYLQINRAGAGAALARLATDTRLLAKE